MTYIINTGIEQTKTTDNNTNTITKRNKLQNNFIIEYKNSHQAANNNSFTILFSIF